MTSKKTGRRDARKERARAAKEAKERAAAELRNIPTRRETACEGLAPHFSGYMLAQVPPSTTNSVPVM